ncbi:MAG: hypothetical protein PHP57_10235 [Sideroxydans sp.]|nr:hypothetical protein [Sideroxydans sp.]
MHTLFLIFALSSYSALTQADELGRLFYSPKQRAQLEAQLANANNAKAVGQDSIMVNGVIQKHGGNRIIWINGQAQPAVKGNDSAPGDISIAVPGKSQPVQVKVGQRLLIDQPHQQTEPGAPTPPTKSNTAQTNTDEGN